MGYAKGMRKLFALSLLLAVGCTPKTDSSSSTPTASGGVAPMGSGAAGGMTPVAGSESVEGSGSGVNQSAMGAAKRAAAKAGSAPSVGGEGGE